MGTSFSAWAVLAQGAADRTGGIAAAAAWPQLLQKRLPGSRRKPQRAQAMLAIRDVYRAARRGVNAVDLVAREGQG